MRYALIFFCGSFLWFAYADQLAGRTACDSLLSHSQVMQDIALHDLEGENNQGNNLDNWRESYLNLLNLVLEGIDEIDNHAFGHAERAEVKAQLLQKIVSSSTPVNPLKELQTNFSPRLSTLADSGQFEIIAENIREDDWVHIRQSAQQTLEQIQAIHDLQSATKKQTREDYEETPDLNGDTRLHRFIRSRQLEQALHLINSSRISTRYINHINRKGQTALDVFNSLKTSHLDLRDALMRKNALTKDQLFSFDSDLISAAEKNDCSKIQELYDLGLNMNWHNEEIDFTRVLSQYAPLHEARLVRNRNGKILFATTPLHRAIEKKHLEAVKLLVKFGANLDTWDDSGVTPLICAIKYSSIEIVEALLSGQPNLEMKDSELVANRLRYARYPWTEKLWVATPFLWTLYKGRDDVMNLLIAHGAKPNAQALFAEGALHILPYSKVKDPASTVKWLLALGLDIDQQDLSEETPLHSAVLNNNFVLVRELLSQGANLSLQDRKGRTPYLLAKSLKFHDSAKSAAIKAEFEKYLPLSRYERFKQNTKQIWSRIKGEMKP